jgi:group I intron endonuclease
MQYIGNKEDWYKSGIYKISNKIDDRIYIGSSTRLRCRYLQHRNKLKHGRHNSKYLQRFCNKYSINTLVFEVIEIIEPELLIIKEDEYINKLSPAFNSMPSAVLPKGYKHTLQTTQKMSLISKQAFDNGRVIWNKGVFKFSKDEVVAIRARIDAGEAQAKIARELNVGNSVINRLYKHQYNGI